MLSISLEEIAEITGGRLADVSDPAARMTAGAVTDSREAVPGSLFAALAGERVDGHAFATQTVAAGAVGVLAARPVGVPAVVVPDVIEALAALARHALAQLPDPLVIGLTGSAGKTSTKDLLAQVLPVLGPTSATDRSFNGEIGMPLTLLRAAPDTRLLVLEMGARGKGHIANLTRIAPPQAGLVLNVGTAHIGEFGSRETIAQAKSELVQALPADGLAVLNADDPLVAAMAAKTPARVMRFGLGTAGRDREADVWAEQVHLDGEGRPSFTLHHDGGHAEVRLTLHGRHHVMNALAAATVALGLGAGLQAVADRLSAAKNLTTGRMQVLTRPDGLTVINDAFNANPDSMAMALAALTAMAGTRRTIAVLGEMKELGAQALDGHRQLGKLAANCGIQVLVAVGADHAQALADAARRQNPALTVIRTPDRDGVPGALADILHATDIVLVKASHSAGLETTALLLAAGT
ncbi:UDP-N-acetylmuramoyl-tripeptide--D-alanyl-D-alanine ligase [Streptomyces sp. AS58]|uniref:UDP-N-acetylmuramoyl-tripeptide--D-alanyl-D- alanine ligase n=1 Tax=Streptomyces sp. AS58 TaxID=1519489 RepID=UPI0006ADA374|nr:UDP-N-acetylmuramoyl-tripeptide--D-alanyl-D-alanine ligase [Streptomyces sp. AS58]